MEEEGKASKFVPWICLAALMSELDGGNETSELVGDVLSSDSGQVRASFVYD